jgi:isopenicillin N synthase-like dioxygenase
MYEAFKGIGFVSIVNHGLDQRLVDGAFAQARVRCGNYSIENSEYFMKSLSFFDTHKNLFRVEYQ